MALRFSLKGFSEMAKQVPESLTVRCQKALREAGLAEFRLDLTKVSDAGLADLLYAGAYTRHTAGTTHLFDKARKAGNGVPTVEDWRSYTAAFVSKYEAPEFVARARAEAGEEELSLEDQALLMALKPRFKNAGVIWHGAAEKKDKEGKVVKPAKPAKTVLDVIDELGGENDNAWEIAAKRVATDYLTKQGMDSDKIPGAVEGSWKKIQQEAKDHLKSLKARAAAEF